MDPENKKEKHKGICKKKKKTKYAFIFSFFFYRAFVKKNIVTFTFGQIICEIYIYNMCVYIYITE